MKLTLLFLFLLCINNTKAFDDTLQKNVKINDNDVLYKLAKPYVFQVKTSQSKNAPKVSYGTGFVVDGQKGILLTNYHVISTFIQDEDNKYKIYLVDFDKNYEVEILDFSVIYDLALIKVNRKFNGELKLKKKEPNRGETIFSIGLPKDLNISLVEGSYNGVIKNSIYQRILMSTPINSGMSGGPTVNKNGEVIGVNVSVLRKSQNITFSVPINRGIDLLTNFLKNKKRINRKDYQLKIKNQLTKIENALSIKFKEQRKGKQTKSLGAWIIRKPANNTKCWSNNVFSKKRTYQKISESCFLKSSAYLERNLYGGSYYLDYVAYLNLKRKSFQFASVVKKSLNYYSKFKKHKELTKYNCYDGIYTNPKNISFKYVYCLSAYIKYPDLYVGYFKAATLGNIKDALIFDITLEGISKKGILDFILIHLDLIEKKINK